MSNILVVDDDPDFLGILAESLRYLGHEVTPFNNPTEAIALFDEKGQNFDVIVTDLIMPEIDGIELISRIRARDPAIQIVAISGGGRMNGIDHSELSLNAGANRYLKKPFGIQELSELVSELAIQDKD